jgi:hypothetical protein
VTGCWRVSEGPTGDIERSLELNKAPIFRRDRDQMTFRALGGDQMGGSRNQ